MLSKALLLPAGKEAWKQMDDQSKVLAIKRQVMVVGHSNYTLSLFHYFHFSIIITFTYILVFAGLPRGPHAGGRLNWAMVDQVEETTLKEKLESKLLPQRLIRPKKLS